MVFKLFKVNKEFVNLINFVENSGTYLFLSESEAIHYRSLALNVDSLNSIMTKVDINSVEYDEYNAQKEFVLEQINTIHAKRKVNQELVKRYYKEYLVQEEELSKIKRTSSFSYISDGQYYKGFNYSGNLVAIFDKYNNYMMIEYEKYLLDNGQYAERIAKVYDNTKNQATFGYNDQNLLSFIMDNRGKKVSFTYSNNYLNKISYDTGEIIALIYDEDSLLSISESKHSLSTLINYAFSRPSRICHYSGINNISKDSCSLESNAFSIIELTYSPTETLPVERVVIKNNLTKEKYCFNENGFNTEYYLEENGYVTKAEQYQYTPYWIGSVAQTDPKKVVVSALKSSLNSAALSTYIFQAGDTVTTSINQFNKPIKRITSNIKISDSLTQADAVTYIYDDYQQLIEEYTETTFKNINGTTVKTIPVMKKYNYNTRGCLVRTESYIVGEEVTKGKHIKEIVYDEKGNVIRSFSYNTLKSSDKFYSEKEFNEKGQIVSTIDSLGQNKTKLEYIDGTNTIKSKLLPNGSNLSYGYDYDDIVTSITQSTEDGEENSNSKVFKYGEVIEVNSPNNNIKYEYDFKRRIISLELDGISDYVENSYSETKSGDAITKTVITSTYKNGDVVVSEYDGVNNLIRATVNGLDQIQNTYNSKRQLTKTVDMVTETVVELSYDNFDKLTDYKETNTAGTTIRS
ncbi:MAG: hypothetical protein IJD46_03975 [Bacilli bacterium]|nr:hypothetical protein [Bacilli bacterium]